MIKSDYLGPYLLGPNNTPENGIYTGDARELAKAIPDESVDLIFTDPPYIGDTLYLYKWIGSASCRFLSTKGHLLTYFGTGFLDEVLLALKSGGLFYRWLLDSKFSGRPLLYGKIAVKGQRCLWMTKQKRAQPPNLIWDTWQVSEGTCYLQASASGWSGGKANWGKDINTVLSWMSAFNPSVTLDPFCGMGTFMAVCKMLGRRYLAFEIDPDVAEIARERVRNTQPPLFVPQPEQLEMEICNDENDR